MYLYLLFIIASWSRYKGRQRKPSRHVILWAWVQQIVPRLKAKSLFLFIFTVSIGTFDPHGLILCVSEGFLWSLLWSHNACMGTFDLHELIWCVPVGFLSQLLCNYTVCIGTFDLHGLILCVSEGLLFEWMLICNVGIETFDLHGLI